MTDKKLSYKEIIKALLESQPNKWFMSYELIGKRVEINGKEYWLGTSADRLARDLALDGAIEREGRDEGQFYAKYRAKREVGQLAMF